MGTFEGHASLVAIAVAVAGGSGLFGSLKEAIAPAKTIVEASQGNNTLLREICNREEMKAAKRSLRDQFKATKYDALRENMRTTAISNVKSTMDLLREKASDEDRKAYQDFVNKIGIKSTKKGALAITRQVSIDERVRSTIRSQ